MSRLLPCLFVLVVAGCAFHPPDVGEKVDPIPEADSPQNLVVRFERVYEQQSLVLYEPLLTSDFRYTFSAASDPTLVAQYGNNWGKDDETETTKHLFEGFTNSAGDPVPAASKIDMTLSGVQYAPDPFHADSAAYYQKVVLSSVVMEIDVPASPDPIVYNISARHEFYIVRRDAAAQRPAHAGSGSFLEACRVSPCVAIDPGCSAVRSGLTPGRRRP